MPVSYEGQTDGELEVKQAGLVLVRTALWIPDADPHAALERANRARDKLRGELETTGVRVAVRRAVEGHIVDFELTAPDREAGTRATLALAFLRM